MNLFWQGFEKQSKEAIPGGLAAGKPDTKYDPKQLAAGTKVETKEHTQDTKKAKEITKDHLEEHPAYYTHLEKMENKLEKKAFWQGFEKQAISSKYYARALAATKKSKPDTKIPYRVSQLIRRDLKKRELGQFPVLSKKQIEHVNRRVRTRREGLSEYGKRQ